MGGLISCITTALLPVENRGPCHHGCSTGSEVGGASPYVMALKEALMSLRVEGDILFRYNQLCNRYR